MENTILYRFKELKLTQFSTFDSNYSDEDGEIEIQNFFRFTYESTENVLSCTTRIKISSHKKDILKADLDSIFQLAPQSVKNLKDGEDIVLSPALLIQFASLSYGSMRGILYAKTMGTPLSKIILPPNNFSNIFTEPLYLSAAVDR